MKVWESKSPRGKLREWGLVSPPNAKREWGVEDNVVSTEVLAEKLPISDLTARPSLSFDSPEEAEGSVPCREVPGCPGSPDDCCVGIKSPSSCTGRSILPAVPPGPGPASSCAVFLPPPLLLLLLLVRSGASLGSGSGASSCDEPLVPPSPTAQRGTGPMVTCREACTLHTTREPIECLVSVVGADGDNSSRSSVHADTR